jgi:hypothetical protein
LPKKLGGGNSQGDILPSELSLDDPVHRIIYDKKLQFTPIKLYTEFPIELPKPSLRKTIPPNISEPEPLLGFTPANVNNSFFWCVLSIMAYLGCKLPESTKELRTMALKKLKGGILGNKMKDFQFNLQFHKYREFLENFANEKVGLDKNFYLVEALAQSLYRPIVIVSSLERHKENPLLQFNPHADRPPLVMGLYSKGGHEVFLPYILNKNTEFKLENLKKTVSK